ncbi:MAG: tetraacyldisaccharide 4'-kinase [Pseudomonadota bacterium]
MPESKTVRGWVEQGWYGGRSRPLLAPLAWLFATFTAGRRLAYRCGLLASHHPGVPVIVVGNLTAGGTGKTPLTIWLAAQLRERGINVGVVLRGYGGTASAPQCVHPGSDPAEVGDEAVVVARRAGCPVAVGRARIAAARLLVEQGCEVVISDDGLQHLAMQRDLEIVVIDGARGFGNGAFLPRGPLRESPDRLNSVDAVVINGGGPGVSARIKAPLSMDVAAVALCSVTDGERLALAALRGREVHAVAGIGNPERFFAQLRALGCASVQHVFADHHAYTPADLEFADPLPIVMTEKDAVKCRPFATDRMQYLQVSATLPDADAARLLQLVQDCLIKGERIHA